MRRDRYVIAYDISSNRRRNRLAKLLKGWGQRVNLSVFECEIEKGKFSELREEVLKIIKKNKDIVIYYPLCLNCLAEVQSDGAAPERNLNQAVISV
ncbi:MAG: CRISPR-associated endonuclease Cas2 [Desulfobacteraceae bacterium]|nr:MAG: CRISPR-associated endonuclease Cas2 [Desulfobacteraceae bacterium]